MLLIDKALFFIDGSLLIVQFGFDKLARSADVLLLSEFSIDNAYVQETFWCCGMICLRLLPYAFALRFCLSFCLGLVCVEVAGVGVGFVADKTKGCLIAKKALRNAVRI